MKQLHLEKKRPQTGVWDLGMDEELISFGLNQKLQIRLARAVFSWFSDEKRPT